MFPVWWSFVYFLAEFRPVFRETLSRQDSLSLLISDSTTIKLALDGKQLAPV
jgi:hypothetical protein